MLERLYRYHEFHTCSVDENEVPYDHRTYLSLTSYLVIKETKMGVWIDLDARNIDGEPAKRFVNLWCKKRFAHPTKHEALVSFICRKERQISILSRQLGNVREALRVANDKLKEEEPKKYSANIANNAIM